MAEEKLCQEVDKRLIQRSGTLAHLFNWSPAQAEDLLSGVIFWSAVPLLINNKVSAIFRRYEDAKDQVIFYKRILLRSTNQDS